MYSSPVLRITPLVVDSRKIQIFPATKFLALHFNNEVTLYSKYPVEEIARCFGKQTKNKKNGMECNFLIMFDVQILINLGFLCNFRNF
jgi:hypothetical protein